eukprot:COSAG02_NODE_1965_length_10236_cov_4.020907_4_plen_158_part_00
MDAGLAGLAYWLEAVASRGQLLEFLAHCGEDAGDYEDDDVQQAVQFYAYDDVYRGMAALAAVHGSKVPGAMRRRYDAQARGQRNRLPKFEPRVRYDVALASFVGGPAGARTPTEKAEPASRAEAERADPAGGFAGRAEAERARQIGFLYSAHVAVQL